MSKKKHGFRLFPWKNRGNLKNESSKKHANFPLFRKNTAAFGNHLQKKVIFDEKQGFFGNFSLYLAT